jgi:uncharacterized Zn-binding protein involved in type VI secretion
MEKDKDFAGKNGFIWWTGIVENRNDPLKLGQCQVRCVGWDADNKMHLPTVDLPWAKPLLPVNGTNVFAPKEGDMIIGFFIDGESAQERVMMGILPNIPLKASNPQQAFTDPRTATELKTAPKTPKEKTYNVDGTGIKIVERDQAESYPKILDEPSTSRIARNDAASITKTFIQERKDKVVTGIETVNDTWNEPKTKYDSVYPYNNVKETESGHVLEFDDTPEKERIHLAHRNGSFQEWFPDGDKVEKVTKDNYQIIMGNDRVYIMGKCQITVQGDAEIYVKEKAYVKVDSDVIVEVGGNYTEHVTGTYKVVADGNMTIDAPLINLNSGSKGAARIGDTADTGDAGTGGHFDTNSAGTNVIETGSATVIIGG